MELIESAHPRYRQLAEALGARDWRRRLRDVPTLVREVLELERSLPEALERTERRGEQEGWPPGSSIPRIARQVRVLRVELTARVRRKLKKLLVPAEELSLEGCLLKLEDLRGQDLNLERLPGESFELHLGSVSGLRSYAVSALYALGSLVLGGGCGSFCRQARGRWCWGAGSWSWRCGWAGLRRCSDAGHRAPSGSRPSGCCGWRPVASLQSPCDGPHCPLTPSNGMRVRALSFVETRSSTCPA
ncbi:hypothetical protein WA016_04772 [Myxococcus stipitatus]